MPTTRRLYRYKHESATLKFHQSFRRQRTQPVLAADATKLLSLTGSGCGYQTSPSRQSQASPAVSSRLATRGKTNTEPSSSGVRVGPLGASTAVGPRHGSQPRSVESRLPRSEELSALSW